ncbi:MAG: hypothetical protein CSB48_10985 [Proteobacteria bacterium]|nr:MAG: hypothetical protein CSB48_10985 [Pseudomonadota bacterium]
MSALARLQQKRQVDRDNPDKPGERANERAQSKGNSEGAFHADDGSQSDGASRTGHGTRSDDAYRAGDKGRSDDACHAGDDPTGAFRDSRLRHHTRAAPDQNQVPLPVLGGQTAPREPPVRTGYHQRVACIRSY